MPLRSAVSERVERAVGVEPHQRHIAHGGTRRAADEDDVAVGFHDKIVARVKCPADVGLGDAGTAEPEVQAAVRREAGDDRVEPPLVPAIRIVPPLVRVTPLTRLVSMPPITVPELPKVGSSVPSGL